MNESNIARSIKARLMNMADGDNKRYQQLVLRYLHERLLYRLSKSDYGERFILKGGVLLYAFEEFVPRPTSDIDFLGDRIANDKGIILDAFKSILAMSSGDDGITFQSDTLTADDITVEKKYPGIRIGIVCKLGTYKQNLTMDIGFGDVVIPKPVDMEYPTIFDSMDEPVVKAYSLEAVVAEKFQTMIDRGRFNSRMKDYFDLYRIFSAHQFDNALLSEAIKATFENRGTEFVEGHDFFSEDFGKDTMLNQQWKNYIRKMKLDLPSFPDMHNSIANWLMPYWRMLKKE